MTVNGQKLKGGKTEVPIPETGKARIRVQVRAGGYKPYAQVHTITGDKTIEIELRKARKPDGGGPSGPGGLIKL